MVSVEEEKPEVQEKCPNEGDKGQSEGQRAEEESAEEGCEGDNMILSRYTNNRHFLHLKYNPLRVLHGENASVSQSTSLFFFLGPQPALFILKQKYSNTADLA